MCEKKDQNPESAHRNKCGLAKKNFCLAQAVEGERQESISSPPQAMYAITFSKSSARHDFYPVA